MVSYHRLCYAVLYYTMLHIMREWGSIGWKWMDVHRIPSHCLESIGVGDGCLVGAVWLRWIAPREGGGVATLLMVGVEGGRWRWRC